MLQAIRGSDRARMACQQSASAHRGIQVRNTPYASSSRWRAAISGGVVANQQGKANEFGQAGTLTRRGAPQLGGNFAGRLTGFHRIRHYGLLATSRRACTIARIRAIIAAPILATVSEERDADGRAGMNEPHDDRRPPCPCCGGRMILVEHFAPGAAPRTILAIRVDTS